jgi:hypothetical protein
MIYNIIFIFFITFAIAFIFGLTLINIIDNRLNKIIIPEKFENYEEIKESINPSNPGKYNKEYYNQMEFDSIVKGNNKNDTFLFKEWNIENVKTQVCIKNHKHEKKGNDLNCTYGLTNHADPNDMSSIDYKIFKLNYPNNMTLQDYINWLYCYTDKENELPYNHLKNLEKLKLGIELVEQHGILPPPGYYYPPLKAEDYFDKLYNQSNEFQVASPLNSTTGPMLGYNYNEYSEFSQNIGDYGDSGNIRNTDIALKKNAKNLYNYINPKDSNSLEINKENEIYHRKNIEL